MREQREARIMSHRQSCDRCRQQKVRCLRDEAQQENSNPSSPGRASLSQCERCAKAGVDCVYSCMLLHHLPVRFVLCCTVKPEWIDSLSLILADPKLTLAFSAQ